MVKLTIEQRNMLLKCDGIMVVKDMRGKCDTIFAPEFVHEVSKLGRGGYIVLSVTKEERSNKNNDLDIINDVI